MRATRHCLSLVALAALTLGLGPAVDRTRAHAQSAESAASVATVYQIKVGRFNLGSFRVSANVQGGQYRMKGDGAFSVLEGLIFKWRGALAGAGQVTEAGPEPATYSFSYSAGKKSERLRVTFGKGYVKQVTIAPHRRQAPGTIPVRKEQLEGVLDPLSGTFLTARSANPNGDLSVCNQLLPVFDGWTRFDLVLKPKKRVLVQNKAATSYTGPAAVCRVKFIPISGYRPDDRGIQTLKQSNEIEVWLIPVRGTQMYVPYRIAMPTPAGVGTAVLTSMRVSGVRRASVD